MSLLFSNTPSKNKAIRAIINKNDNEIISQLNYFIDALTNDYNPYLHIYEDIFKKISKELKNEVIHYVISLDLSQNVKNFLLQSVIYHSYEFNNKAIRDWIIKDCQATSFNSALIEKIMMNKDYESFEYIYKHNKSELTILEHFEVSHLSSLKITEFIKLAFDRYYNENIKIIAWIWPSIRKIVHYNSEKIYHKINRSINIENF